MAMNGNMSKKMRYGDILLFESSNRLVSRLISKIDGSKYSHGAIYLGEFGGEHLFIESHESKGGVVIQRLEEWRSNYVVLRPNYIKKPRDIEETLELLNREYDYGRLPLILKSKIWGGTLTNNDPYKVICTELCDFVHYYNLGAGKVCTPNTIYRLAKSGKLDVIKGELI